VTSPSGLAIDVIGVDGSVWPLLDAFAPVRLGTSYRGLFSPRGETIWAERDSGRRRRARNLSGRTIELRIIIGDVAGAARRGEDWRQLDEAWWTALGGGDAPFTLRVTTPGADLLGRPKQRLLQLWDESIDEGMGIDPAQTGRGVYTVTAEAESALFSGPEVTAPFIYNPSVDVDYYGAEAGLGPPFYIGGGSQFANATITNPGQSDAWPRWKVTAPFNSASVGLVVQEDGKPVEKLVPLPFRQITSQTVVIDTDPRRRSITDGSGNNLWPLIGPGLDPLFAPVPPGVSVPLAIVLDNPAAGSRVDVALTPEYRRAW
jgi:hypothetical protein